MTELTIIYDGQCRLCAGAVRYISHQNRHNRFSFYARESFAADKEMRRHSLKMNDVKSVIVMDEDGVHTKSDATIRIMKRLGGLWMLASILKVIPRFIRDKIYDLIAARRYRWFGGKACPTCGKSS